jgi:hypothetical protein
MDALSEFNHNGEYARAFLAFSSSLATFDRHPEVTRPGDEYSLLWRYKWIVWQMTQFSAVPLERALALLEDMERRYREGNHSLHAVCQHRAIVATHLGKLDESGRWIDEMAVARRDSLADCAACVPTTQVEFLVATGQWEEAVRVGSPYSLGGCSEQPQQMLSQLLLPYLKTGRLAEAAVAHKKIYPRIRDNRHYLELIALHVQFLALTGNAEQGRPIVERHLPWLDRPASPYAAMEFASAAALLLRLAGSPSADLTGRARALAADFDTRNGNAYQSGRVEGRLAAAPIVASLALTVLGGRPVTEHAGKAEVDELVGRIARQTAAGDLAGAAQARLRAAYVLRNHAQWGDAVEVAEEAMRSLDGAGLTEDGHRARYLLVELYQRVQTGRDARSALIEELLAAPSLPPELPDRPSLLEQHGGVVKLREAADLHRQAGDGEAEARLLVRVLQRLGTRAPESIVARLDELGPPAGIQALLCWAESGAGKHEAALARARRHGLGELAAYQLLRLGRNEEAEAGARALLADEDYDGWMSAVTLVRSLQSQGRTADADQAMAEHDVDPDDLTAKPFDFDPPGGS